MLIIVICLFMENKSLTLKKPAIKVLTFGLNCLESIYNGFSASESGKVSLKENVHDFSIDYNSVHKFDILNIQKYLLGKNNNKTFFNRLQFYS